MASEVRIAIEYVGHDLGLWCDDCLLSTGVRVWYTVTTGDVSTLRGSLWCVECGRRNVRAGE